MPLPTFKSDVLGDSLYLGRVVFGLFVVYFLGKVTRNLYFHPLSKYPGPKLFAATSLVNTYLLVRGERVYKVAELHDKYGPIVRIAPDELSYVDADAWKGVYGVHPNSQLKKHQAPDPLNDDHLFSCPTDEGHSLLRKTISPAFSEKNIRDREGILRQYTDLLIQRLEESMDKPQDLVFWYECATLDITGHLTFGESFQCLETSTLHPVMTTAIVIFRFATILVDLIQYPVVPWLFLLVSKFVENPIARGLIGRTVTEKLQKREQSEARGDGAMSVSVSYLFKGKGTPKELPGPAIHGVTTDLLMAGSDTVATVLSAATYLLLQHPRSLLLLQDELMSSSKSQSKLNLSTVSNLKYLNAVIQETMRLIPAAPETFRRVTNRGGNLISGKLVPAGTVVGVYHWAAGHNKASWKDVESFIPERWLGDERFKNDDKGVVQFFNTGPRNCVGQNLANAELRLILANIFWELDLELMPESSNWTDMKSWGLIYEKRPLMVKVTSSGRGN